MARLSCDLFGHEWIVMQKHDPVESDNLAPKKCNRCGKTKWYYTGGGSGRQ